MKNHALASVKKQNRCGDFNQAAVLLHVKICQAALLQKRRFWLECGHTGLGRHLMKGVDTQSWFIRVFVRSVRKEGLYSPYGRAQQSAASQVICGVYVGPCLGRLNNLTLHVKALMKRHLADATRQVQQDLPFNGMGPTFVARQDPTPQAAGRATSLAVAQ